MRPARTLDQMHRTCRWAHMDYREWRKACHWRRRLPPPTLPNSGRLLALRRALRLNQVEVAPLVGMTQAAVSMAERGYRPRTAAKVYAKLLAWGLAKGVVDRDGERIEREEEE